MVAQTVVQLQSIVYAPCLHFQAACQQAIPGSVDAQTRLIALWMRAFYIREILSIGSTLLHFLVLPVSQRRFMLVDSVGSRNTSQGVRYGD